MAIGTCRLFKRTLILHGREDPTWVCFWSVIRDYVGILSGLLWNLVNRLLCEKHDGNLR